MEIFIQMMSHPQENFGFKCQLNKSNRLDTRRDYSNDAPSPKKSWFQILVKSVEPFGYKKRLCRAYTLLCKLNYGNYK